jgi:hypothetical protein
MRAFFQNCLEKLPPEKSATLSDPLDLTCLLTMKIRKESLLPVKLIRGKYYRYCRNIVYSNIL